MTKFSDLSEAVDELVEDYWHGHEFNEWGANHGPEMGCAVCYFISLFAEAGVKAAQRRVAKAIVTQDAARATGEH